MLYFMCLCGLCALLCGVVMFVVLRVLCVFVYAWLLFDVFVCFVFDVLNDVVWFVYVCVLVCVCVFLSVMYCVMSYGVSCVSPGVCVCCV